MTSEPTPTDPNPMEIEDYSSDFVFSTSTSMTLNSFLNEMKILLVLLCLYSFFSIDGKGGEE